MKKDFQKHIGALEDVFQFVSGFVSKQNIDSDVAFSMNLAVEELFTNMVKYNVGGSEISIGIALRNDGVVLELIDQDVDPFDPSTVRDVVPDDPIEKRDVGGLGLHLVRSVVDKLAYEYKDRQMKVTVTKRLE